MIKLKLSNWLFPILFVVVMVGVAILAIGLMPFIICREPIDRLFQNLKILVVMVIGLGILLLYPLLCVAFIFGASPLLARR